MIWDISFSALLLAVSGYFLVRALEWWQLGSTMKFISNPTSHLRRLADWQQRIDEAQADLEYYQNTPNWFDLEWPVCDNLTISSDGQYCSNCFRQVYDHGVMAR